MNAPDHGLRAHAKLSASSSDRWLNCTAAPTMEASFEDERSVFAAEGTTAHELAERCLVSGRHAHDMSGDYPTDMRDYVQMYLDYVRATPGELMVEQRFDLGRWIPDGFGTGDATIISDGVLDVKDLKYGKGLKVFAENNSQLKLYGLGALEAFDCIYGPIKTVRLHICQPRLDHFDVWEISAEELLTWGESIKPIARVAFDGPGETKAGDHCQFCKARHTCRTRAEVNLAIARDEMGEYCPPSDTLSDAELADLYPKLDELTRWANDLQAYCLARAERGVKFPGLKLVEGRSNRKITDSVAAYTTLIDAGFDSETICKPQELLGITALESVVGKKNFTELLGQYVAKPQGKPTLVVATDKRPEFDPSQQQAAIAEMTNA